MKPAGILLKMEHSFSILCDNSDEHSNSAYFGSETDPLEELRNEVLATKPRFYRVDNIVFAEPLKPILNEEASSKDSDNKDEIRIIDNVTVYKRSGKKYKKYQFKVAESAPTKCPQLDCLRTFPTKQLLRAHIRRTHCADPKKYICDQCGRGFPEPHILRRHLDTHSGKTVECPICSVKLSKSTSLSNHLRSHSNQRPHECLICKKKFGRASSMATHVKFVHREGLLECDNDECDKRFSSRKQWNLHMRTHRKEKPCF